MVDMLTVLTIVFTVILGVGALVAPLYMLVLRMRNQDGVDSEQLSQIAESQEEIAKSVSEMGDELVTIRHDVETNMARSEKNQRHIHQILVGDYNAEDDNEIGNPHHTAEHCPLPHECSFHSPEDVPHT